MMASCAEVVTENFPPSCSAMAHKENLQLSSDSVTELTRSTARTCCFCSRRLLQADDPRRPLDSGGRARRGPQRSGHRGTSDRTGLHLSSEAQRRRRCHQRTPKRAVNACGYSSYQQTLNVNTSYSTACRG